MEAYEVAREDTHLGRMHVAGIHDAPHPECTLCQDSEAADALRTLYGIASTHPELRREIIKSLRDTAKLLEWDGQVKQWADTALRFHTTRRVDCCSTDPVEVAACCGHPENA